MSTREVIQKYNWLTLMPIVSIIFYVLFFIWAKSNYGGESDNYLMTSNLLCDMMEKLTNTGQYNYARPIAVTGHIVLFLGMTIFFYMVPLEFKGFDMMSSLIQYLGVSSMILFIFLYTDYHDELVLIAGTLSTASGILLSYRYLKSESSIGRNFAIFCLFLSVCVFISFQFKIALEHLPSLQKTVFVLDSIWVLDVGLRLRNDK